MDTHAQLGVLLLLLLAATHVAVGHGLDSALDHGADAVIDQLDLWEGAEWLKASCEGV